MKLKEKVEENVALWLLGMLVTGFLSGIGAYKAILEIAQLAVVPKSAEIVSLNREVERLKDENQRLRSQKEERVEPNGKTELPAQELSKQATGTEKSTESQVGDTSVPSIKTDQGSQEGKLSGTIVLKDGSEMECPKISFRDMHLIVFQYWWDPEKVKSLTEMPFENIRSLRPGILRKVENISPDFIEVQLERVDGKVISVYSLSNYEFYCHEENLPQATAFPITQIKRIQMPS